MIAVLIAGAATEAAIDLVDQVERSHGRSQRRRTSVYAIPPGWISSDWRGVCRLIVVDRWRGVGASEVTISRHLYISSHSHATAAAFAKWISGHWQIENALHWVKDVIQNEDRSGIGGSAAVTLSTLKTWALSLFRVNGMTSIKNATIRFANKISDLYALTRT